MDKMQAEQLAESLLKETLEQLDQLSYLVPLIQEILYKMIHPQFT
ncbi:MAG: hypothetical protein ACRDAI_06055 [Candidatus Rhabdochlamydia sp.]